MAFEQIRTAVTVIGIGLAAFALLWGLSYGVSRRLARRLGAKELIRSPENLSIFLSLERLVRRAQMPMPRIYLLEDYSPNAFAIGRGQIVVTEGLLESLTLEELEAVLGLCLAQLKLKGFRTAPFATMLAMPFTRLARRLPLALKILLQSFASVMVRALVRPERMFQADSFAARIVQNPDQIALSLRKLTSLSRRIPIQRQDVALDHMFVISAIHDDLIASTCATHPDPERRIKRLLDASLPC